MNKTVELVKLWGDFEEKNPEATIEEFCRYQLNKSGSHSVSMPQVEGIPLTADSWLMILIVRIAKLHLVYANIALEGTGLSQIEEFGILISILNRSEDPRKTDVIQFNMQELSSGTNMIERLKKKGMIVEYDDQEDRRSKRLKLTDKGKKVCQKGRGRMAKLARMILKDLGEQDKLLCIQLLKNTEAKFIALLPKQKNKGFDEIYKENMDAEINR